MSQSITEDLRACLYEPKEEKWVRVLMGAGLTRLMKPDKKCARRSPEWHFRECRGIADE
jgi:hypothetical protein